MRWFVEPGSFPLRAEDIFTGATLVTLVAILGAVVTSWLIRQQALAHGWQDRFQAMLVPRLARHGVSLAQPRDLYAYLPAILAVHVAVLLFVRGVSRQFLVPNLPLRYSMVGGAMALAEIVIALFLLGGLVIGGLTRVAAVGLLLLTAFGMLVFGPLQVMEHSYYFGIAAFLFITGPGPRAGRWFVHGLGRPIGRLLPFATRIVTATFGFATLLTGFTEKLANQDLAMAFLRDHPFNLTSSTPFAISDANFVFMAGLGEAVLGAVLLFGALPRLAMLAAWVPFNLAVPFLGWPDVLGHLPIYAIILTVLIAGDGRDLARAWDRRHRAHSVANRSPETVSVTGSTPAVSAPILG